MENLSKYLNKAALLVSVLFLFACKKMVSSPDGTANVYLTAAINNLYPVPGIPANYIADKAAKKLRVPVYISRSGLQGKTTYTVNVAADNSAAQKLIDNGQVNASKAIVAPAETYSFPATVTAGEDYSGFEVAFDVNKLNAYLGKLLILSVRISDPSKFQVSEKLSVLNIVLDVDPVMLGTKVEITDTWIRNSGHPFTASSFDGVRRGVLSDWTTSASVKNYAGGTLGGYDYYGNTGFMSMERYSSPQIPNGKIYQSFELPAGKYEVAVNMLDFSIKEDAYIMAAPGSSLPDIGNIGTALAYSPLTAPRIEFVLAAPTQVSIGVMANLLLDQQYMRIDKWRLYTYKGLWD
ncbi:MAG: DUF5013 domain-containing protein [Chitinophagaceae bacterium]|nr:DUF5013 domain-containing protein [Chitinophagaceae bacterium]